MGEAAHVAEPQGSAGSGASGRTLLVLRHGQTAHNAGGVWQGHLDTELSELGRSQALAAAELLRDAGIVRIVSSDLRRAGDTAAAVGAALGLPVAYDARLREIHVGQWQGMAHADIVSRWPEVVAAVSTGDDPRRGIDGETVAEVSERSRPAVTELLASLGTGETGLVVTHGVAARAIVADVVGMPQRVAWNCLTGLHNCHWAECHETEHGWRIAGWDVGAHSDPARMQY